MDCFLRVMREEGIGTFYRSLPPRLMSVVPMIAIQFGVYEALKAQFILMNKEKRIAAAAALRKQGTNWTGPGAESQAIDRYVILYNAMQCYDCLTSPTFCFVDMNPPLPSPTYPRLSSAAATVRTKAAAIARTATSKARAKRLTTVTASASSSASTSTAANRNSVSASLAVADRR
jgi:Mitochondrial carrier protein